MVNISSFYQVTSDCRPWEKGGKLGICLSCGSVQSIIDEEWKEEIQRIYDKYTVYSQSDGVEQPVFDMYGTPYPRSVLIVKELESQFNLPPGGRLLDYGCGNGNFLRSFNKFFPAWSLCGYELDDRHKKQIESISQVEQLWSSSPQNITGEFCCISLIHVLEHIVSPVTFLKELIPKLNSNGFLIIQVPDIRQNPFDFLIADHATHFTLESLSNVLFLAGYSVLWHNAQLIPKEIMIIAQKCNKVDSYTFNNLLLKETSVLLKNHITRLLELISIGKQYLKKEKVGIFGSSIAATWLFLELNGKVDFFVDEDLHRIGKTHLDRPIIHPRDVVDWSCVIFTMKEAIVKEILKRYQNNSM